MANYPLSTLLDLRQHRLDDAQRATVAQRLIVQKQVEKVQSLKEELVRREAEGEKHIALIYEEIMNTLIPKDSMGEHMGKIRTIYSELEEFKLTISQAEQELSKAQELLKHKEQEQLSCTQALAKLEKHQEMWLTATKQEQERLAELEMEEFTPRTLPQDNMED